MALRTLLFSTTLAASLAPCVPGPCRAGSNDEAPAAPGTPSIDRAPAASFDLASYRGQVVYLDFWASWCAPCKHSFPWLKEMDAKHATQGLVILAVDVDRDPKAAAAFLADMKPGFRILDDPGGALATAYKLEAMPSSFLYDRKGSLRGTHLGFKTSDRDEIEKEILELLREAPPDSSSP
jgi:thiol-disulfide isomerase/thioredoxin